GDDAGVAEAGGQAHVRQLQDDGRGAVGRAQHLAAARAGAERENAERERDRCERVGARHGDSNPRVAPSATPCARATKSPASVASTPRSATPPVSPALART